MRAIKRAIRLAAWGVVALTWMGAGSLGAQEARKQEIADTVTVVAVAPDDRTLRVKDAGGEEREFRLDQATVIRSGSEEIALSELEKGDRVVVNARKEREGMTEPEAVPVADVILVVVEP